MCRDQAPTQILCENLLFLIAGYTSDQLNAVRKQWANYFIDHFGKIINNSLSI